MEVDCKDVKITRVEKTGLIRVRCAEIAGLTFDYESELAQAKIALKRNGYTATKKEASNEN